MGSRIQFVNSNTVVLSTEWLDGKVGVTYKLLRVEGFPLIFPCWNQTYLCSISYIRRIFPNSYIGYGETCLLWKRWTTSNSGDHSLRMLRFWKAPVASGSSKIVSSHFTHSWEFSSLLDASRYCFHDTWDLTE